MKLHHIIKSSLITFILFFVIDSNAQTIGYTYKALAAEGCSVKYSVSKHNGRFYIITTVSSDRMRFLKEPTMMVKTTKGDILKFLGEFLDNGTQSAGIVNGNIIIPVTSIISTAQFEVSAEQFEQLKNGIIKVKLSTTPIEHERTFKKDKIGKKLYEYYINVRDKEENF